MLQCWECLKETNENDVEYHVIETEDKALFNERGYGG